jgi:quercetin dioxygenase-like cupin family protein
MEQAGLERDDRVLAAPVLTFDLRAELESLRRKPGYGAGEPTGTTLLKEPDLRIVLMALRAGGRMVEHHASGPISVQPIEGRFRFSLPDHSVELEAGQLLALEPGIAHSIEAIEDTAFLLTIGRTTYRDVHDHHEPRG